MRYSITFFLTIVSIAVLAQQKQFSSDDRGKYIYYEVVAVKTTAKDSLMLRATSFFNINKKTIVQQYVTDTSITTKGKTIIDKTVLVASHPSGEVSYTLIFEAKDKKYRFWLTDFEYIPYQRDRYGNYVATTKIGVPLEKSPGKLSANAWKDIVESTYDKTLKLAENFKKSLAINQTEKPKKKTTIIPASKW